MRKAAVLLLLVLGISPAFSQAPVRTEELVYSILAANGRDFSPTFTAPGSDAIYLIADTDSILSPRKTMVYFWPITGEWKTDTSALDIPLKGVLEITDSRGKTRSLLPSRYTFYNVRGEYELNWKVAQGDEAEKVWAHWQGLAAAYARAVTAYQEEIARVQAERASLARKISHMRRAGGDPSSLVQELSSLRDPEEPPAPRDYVVPPTEIREAFVLNLPRGRYSLRLRNPDGSIMEGSDKELVVHARRRSQGTGYEVIPGDKWTRPVESVTPGAVIYVDGSTDLFLRPFFEDEYNDLFYEKTLRNDGRGNPNLLVWKRIQQVPGARIRASRGGSEGSMIHEQAWFVEQTPGDALGYRIAASGKPGEEASLIAFRLPLEKERGVTRLVSLDRTGRPLRGSGREVRVVGQPRAEGLLLALGALPLVLMIVTLVVRSKKYR